MILGSLFKHRTGVSAVLALLLSAITPGGFANPACNPVSLNTCGVPFPSNYWVEEDNTSLTGISVAVPDEVLRPEVRAQLPEASGIGVQQIFSGASGFSAASAVVFEFDQQPDAATLPKYGDDVIMALDLTTGEPLEVRAQINAYARGRKVSAPANVLEVFPLVRWPFGHTVAVVVTKKLAIDGETSDYTALANRAANDENPAAGNYLTQLNQAITQLGLTPEEVRNATLFTVRERSEVLDPIRNLVDKTFAAEHPVRNVQVHYKNYFSRRAALVTGELMTHNYRRENGIGLVDFNGDYQEQWIPFRLTLPRAARSGPVPVALYAHGLGAAKEMDLLVANLNAGLGIATFSVDFPNHGARSTADGGYVFLNLHIDRVSRVIGMMTQNNIDFAAAHKALIGLSDLDVVGKWRWGGCWQCADGTPDLDTGNVFMEGTSLGGVLGSAYAALSPDLKGAVFHVSGVGVTSILGGSALWELAFSNLEPSHADGAEALLMKGAVQQLLDYGDPINYVDLMRYPDNGRPVRPLYVLTGAGDNIVPNDSSVAMARLLDMPLVGTPLYEMPGVSQQDTIDEAGFGISHLPPLAADLDFLIGPVLTDASAHISFMWSETAQRSKVWIRDVILEQ